MCSIIGYLGKSYAAEILVDGLKRMEYRGYDSVGVATVKSGQITIRKGVGKVMEVNQSLELAGMPGHLGIGHTRWATHGGVNDVNAHPHSGCDGTIVVVHNGIIENYQELKLMLKERGHDFKSQTDSEVIAHLIEDNLGFSNDIKKAILNTCKSLQGSFAFVAAFKSGVICGARYDEPLIVGIADNNDYFISSDVLGFLEYTDKAIFLDNKDIVLIDNKKNLQLFNFEGDQIIRPITQVAWELGDADKGKYAHHTIKEIHEQKDSVLKSLDQNQENLKKFCNILTNSKQVLITGSGTSYHSALIAKTLISKYAKIRADVIMSSEFQYLSDTIDKNTALIAKTLISKYAKIRADVIMSSEFQYLSDTIDENTALIAISQSGETADVLQSVKIAKQKNAKLLSIVNVSTSSLSRLSDVSLVLNCGPEIGVAATKSFTSQLSLIFLIGKYLLTNTHFDLDLRIKLHDAISNTIALKTNIKKLTDTIKSAKDIYILGKSVHYPVALEGSLKIKELAYVHAEGIAAGEIKHGPLALIERDTIVIVLNPSDETYNDVINSTNEIKARGAYIIGISDKNNEIYDVHIKLPEINKEFFPLIEIIPLQMIAYYLALQNNVNPDYPRNLAKSVTVR